MFRNAATIIVASIAMLAPVTAQAQAPELASKVAALKASMAANQAALRNYTWVETTTITYNGVVKAVRQAQASYAADGSVQKVPLSAPAPQQQAGGLRGRIIAEKKAELTDYMESAAALVKTYVPPQIAKLEAVAAAGRVTLAAAPGDGATLNFGGYEKPGDNLGISIAKAPVRILGISVATYLDDPSQPVTMTVTMGALPDGTSHVAQTVLNAPAKNLSVTTANSNYTRVR